MDRNLTVASRTGRHKALRTERIQNRTVPALNIPAEYLICTASFGAICRFCNIMNGLCCVMNEPATAPNIT